MIKISVKEGAVSLGELISKKDQVNFYVKNPFYKFYPQQGSSLVKEFLYSVLTTEQYEQAHAAGKEAEPKMYYREFYRKAGEFLGCTPKSAMKLWNAAEFYTKVKPRLHLVDLLARKSKGRIFNPYFKQIIDNEVLLDEVYCDGLKNILPLVFYFEKSPKELKKFLGKALWKRLSNNTFHRNSLLARVMRKSQRPWGMGDDWVGSWERAKAQLIQLETVPSTLLANKHYMGFFDDYNHRAGFDFVTKSYREKFPMKDFTKRIVHQMQQKTQRILDTDHMARQLGERFDVNKFDLESVEAEHDRLTHLINQMRYSPDAIPWLNELSARSFEVAGYRIQLLDSRYLIHQEGLAMKHCVGGYASQVASGEYLVYSITKDGKRISTLGLRKSRRMRYEVAAEPMTQEMIEKCEIRVGFEGREVPIWEFNQHYAFANGRITEMMQVFLGDLIISRLNGDDYVSDQDLLALESHITNPALVQATESGCLVGPSFTKSDLDKFKFNPYNPGSYRSPFDYRFKKTDADDNYDALALMA